MHRSEAIRDWGTRNEALTVRLLRAVQGVDEAALNRPPDPRTWSPAQVVDHLVLANGPYLEEMETGLAGATPTGSDADPPVRLSFIGRLLCKSLGPGGISPVPKSLHPRRPPVPREIIAEWERQQARLLSLLDRSASVNVSAVRVRDPLAPIIPLTIADCFEILTVHTERHVRQIEERVAAATPPGATGTPPAPDR